MIRIYLRENVYEAALNRIRWLYDEFPNVVCFVSGGKDSTVVFHLTLQVARERGRLPLKVIFIDQEAELQVVIDQVRYFMEHPDVEPMWMQIPMLLSNATSVTDHWLYCWDPAAEDKWMRPKEAYSYKENRYGTMRFKKLFAAIINTEFDVPTAAIGGIRGAESPWRLRLLTNRPKYKWVTWAKTLNSRKKQYTFYPIYDWQLSDVWKAIHDNKWRYCALYDWQFMAGLELSSMRVSSVHHEQAVAVLFYLQEIEPKTYERLTQRLGGIDMAAKLGWDDYFVETLPFMFKDWKEYRDYLVEHLITNPDWKERFRRRFAEDDRVFDGTGAEVSLRKVQVASVLTNDWEFVKLNNFQCSDVAMKAKGYLKDGYYKDGSRVYRRGGRQNKRNQSNQGSIA